EFLQKYKTILIAIVITSTVTTLAAYGYFVNKNEKEKSNQKIESLQKSVEALQANTESSIKNEEYLEIEKEEEEEEEEEEEGDRNNNTAVSEVMDQQTQLIIQTKDSGEKIPIKVEEKTVPCLTYANTTVQVSESECDLIKQKNKKSEEIDYGYANCLSQCLAVYRASIPVTTRDQYNSVFGKGAYDDKIDECKGKKDNCDSDCGDRRKDLLKSLWR
ncbi:hypothetical protein ACFL2R_02800, partial [Patescibacteria group bacterium]